MKQSLVRNRPGSDAATSCDFLRERLRRAFTRANQLHLTAQYCSVVAYIRYGVRVGLRSNLRLSTGPQIDDHVTGLSVERVEGDVQAARGLVRAQGSPVDCTSGRHAGMRRRLFCHEINA